MEQQVVTGEQPSAPPAETKTDAVPGQQQEEKQVPLTALEDERRKRQSLEREAENLRRRTELLEQAAAQQQQPKYDPEDIPSFKDVDALLSAKIDQVRQETRQEKISRQVEVAKQKYSDWDEVYQLALQMAEGNPGMADVIMNSTNPAMTAYDYGRLHPSYSEKIKTKVTQELADKINGNLNSQKTLTDAGGGGTPAPEKNWRMLAGSKELRDRINEVKFGRR